MPGSDILFFWLIGILMFAVILLDAVSAAAKKKQKATGITPEIKSVLTPSTSMKDTKEYISETQGLAGKPDALLVESGYIIPVERKPFSNKIRDRYVAQILVYMRLIEEFEGKKPPYGYLILGKNKRKVKILNTDFRQEWLQKLIEEMRAIASEEANPKAAPHKNKCKNCAVQTHCDYRA